MGMEKVRTLCMTAACLLAALKAGDRFIPSFHQSSSPTISIHVGAAAHCRGAQRKRGQGARGCIEKYEWCVFFARFFYAMHLN
jgi:hypothetical protein